MHSGLLLTGKEVLCPRCMSWGDRSLGCNLIMRSAIAQIKATGGNQGFQHPRSSPQALLATTSRFVSTDIVETSAAVGRIGSQPVRTLPLVSHPASELAIKIGVIHFLHFVIETLPVFHRVQVVCEALGGGDHLSAGVDAPVSGGEQCRDSGS